MRKNDRLLLLLAILKFIIPYLLQSHVYEPHRDEFLYLAVGQHLAWGYMEVPPFLSFFAWLTDWLGHSMFWIKFWPNLFGTFTFILCARISNRLGGGKLALWLLFFVFIFSGWLRMFFLFQPNAPEIFFSALMAYCIFRYIQTSRNKYLYFFGIAVGLGLLTKYTIAFWTISLLIGLLAGKTIRIYNNRHFYFGLVLALLIFLPNLLWQISHHFPVIHHMKELKETQLQYIGPAAFIKGQLLMYLPVFFVWMGGIYFCFTIKGRPYRVFFVAFLAFQVIMLILNGKDYYTAGSFTIIFALGARQIGYFLNRSAKSVKYLILAFSVVTGIFFLPVLLPIAPPATLSRIYQSMHVSNSGVLKWEDQQNHSLPQDFADMLSWKEMTHKVSLAYITLSAAEKKTSVIWCDNYGEAGAINFYGSQWNLPEAYSANGSFLFWLPVDFQPDNIVLVTPSKDILNDPMVMLFASANVIDSITNPFAVEYGTKILILKDPSELFRKIFHKKINSLRQQFGSGK